MSSTLPQHDQTVTARIALIGCGMWGRNIARNLSSLGSLAGVGDSNLKAAKSFADEFNASLMSFDAAIADPNIDGIAIVTSAPSHVDLAVPALNAGKAVYIEKPLALNLDDAELIAKAAKDNNQPVMVGHLIRHHAAFQELLSRVNSGAIGKLKHIRASRIAPGRIRDTESVLFDLCPHDLALVAALTDRLEPKSVQCHGFSHITEGVEDSVTAQLVFDNNLTASIEANWLNPVKIHNLTVIGDNGAIVFDDTCDWPKKLTGFTFDVMKDDAGIHLNRDAGTPIPVAPAEPLKDEMANFIAAAKGLAQPLTDIEEALYVQRIMAQMQNALT